MTELSCHPEVPEARQHSGSLCNFTGHPEAIAEGSQKVDEMLKQVQNDKYVSGAHSKHLFPYSPITLFTSKKAAFTLAEVLITLALIGIVAAMTIPTLVQNYQTRAWNTSASVFERKLEEALRQMNTQQVLAGYKSTADFVGALGKYFKINKVCQNDDIMSCFEDKVYWGKNELAVSTENVKTAAQLGQYDWNTETIGVQFANGTTGILAYNPDCRENPFTNQFSGTSCLALLYDTTGFKTPNADGKDLRYINVTEIDGHKPCTIKLSDGTCFTAPFTPAPLTKAECEQLKGYLGIKECYYDTDYWAGAVKTCGGTNKMPTHTQLTAFAEELYGTSISSSGDTWIDMSDYTKNKFEEMGFTYKIESGQAFLNIWSREEYGNGGIAAYSRFFDMSRTSFRNGVNRKVDSVQAFCLVD